MANSDNEKQVDMVLNSIKKDKKTKISKKTDKEIKEKTEQRSQEKTTEDKANNGIVIEPDKENKSTKTYRGYYLENINLKKLNKVSQQTGKDKSQLVNMALEFFFDNLTIKS